MNRFLIIFIITVQFLNQSCQNTESKNSDGQLNVLFIAVDDLRLQAGIYGQSQMITPSIDKFGKEGVVFTKAYCSVPVCGASRASLLSGLRPTPTRFVNYFTKKDIDAPNVPSLPMWFKENGYTTLSRGKIYHHKEDDINAWSEEPYLPKVGIGFQSYITEESKKIVDSNKTDDNPAQVIGPAYEVANVEDNGYPDGMLADKAIEDLQSFSNSDEPFFLAVGFWKPHLPFNAPKKYWDLYNENDIEPATNTFIPKNVLPFSVNNLTELKGYTDFKDAPRPLEGSLKPKDARHLKHGYYASVSYIDVQVGMLIKKIKELHIYENTIIVLWGDHGYKLGEHNAWAKFTNYIVDNHVPLIIKSNDHTNNKKRISQFIEFVDIYPTLCEMAEIEIPESLQGISQLPIMDGSTNIGKETVFFQYLKESIWSTPKDNE